MLLTTLYLHAMFTVRFPLLLSKLPLWVLTLTHNVL